MKLVSVIDWDGMTRSLHYGEDIAVSLSLEIIEIYESCAPLVKERKLRNRFLQTITLDDLTLYCKTLKAVNGATNQLKGRHFKVNNNFKDAKAF